MSAQSQTPTAVPPASASTPSTSSGKGVAKAVVSRLGTASASVFNMPLGITLPLFDGTEWQNWSGILKALLALHEAEDVFDLNTRPNQVSIEDWNSVQRRTKAYLHQYVKQDVYSLIASETDYPTFKHKWDRLKKTYGGASGSTTIFNLWIQLMQA
jgi:hypothetical protein